MTEHVVGICLIAKQLGNLTTEVDQALADIEVVFAIVVNALGIVGHIHLATQFTLGAIGHERRIAGTVEREHPTLKTVFLSRLGSSLAGGIRQSVELCLVGDVQGVSLLFLQQVLRELQREHGGLLCELAQTFLACSVEQSTAAHETVVAVVEKHLLLRRQATVMAMNVLDAFEEAFVETKVIGMLRQNGAHLLCQRIHIVIGLGRQQVEEH